MWRKGWSRRLVQAREEEAHAGHRAELGGPESGGGEGWGGRTHFDFPAKVSGNWGLKHIKLWQDGRDLAEKVVKGEGWGSPQTVTLPR